MRALGSLLLLAALVLLYLGEFDRKSELALHIVELDGRLRFVKAWSVAGLLAVLLLLPGFVQGLLRGKPATVTQAGHRPPPRRAAPEASPLVGPWREAITTRLRAFEGHGCRILLDQAQGLPITLVMEHLTPRRCEEAIAELGQLFQSLPLPPRVRFRFESCPDPGSPRHHLVAKALGQALDPASFKAVPNADQVDVLFHSPDPRWRSDW